MFHLAKKEKFTTAGATSTSATTTSTPATTSSTTTAAASTPATTTSTTTAATTTNNAEVSDEDSEPEEEEKEEKEEEEEKTETKTTITEEDMLPIAVRIFNESHVVHLLWFVLLYIIVYVFFGEFLKRSGDTAADVTMSRTFDYLALFWGIAFTVYLYYDSNEETKANLFEALMDWTINFYDDPLSIFSVSLFMIAFYAIVMLMRVPMGSGLKPYTVELIESKGWILIATLLICYFFKYVLKINLMDIFRDPKVSQLWKSTLSDSPVGEEDEEKTTDATADEEKTTDATADEAKDPVKPVVKKEVFNVSNSNFNYREAQAVCKAYNARLATYDEIEESYKDGGEWCNYGWSADQMAFFPTQKGTWEKLQQSDPRLKNRCGRPGVNGGHIPNPRMKFGANCYGVKPAASALELAQMKTSLESNVPKTPEENLLDKKAEYYRQNADKLKLNSFNRDKWSYY
jgi:hypothetical protein